MVGQRSLDDIVAERKPILGDIISLWAEGTDEQKAAAIDALAKQEEPKYTAMMQTLQRQCDNYERVVGAEFLESYGLKPTNPVSLRRYFIVLGYIRPISDGNEGSRSLAAQRIAMMDPKEYSYAIQALRAAQECSTANDELKRLLWEQGGLRFVPKPKTQHYVRREREDVFDPATAQRAAEGRDYAFAALHYGNPDTSRRR